MSIEKYYLKKSVVTMPLVDNWYAWSHLIPPATAALNYVSRHFKIMESYIKVPQFHISAQKAPSMKGGPFIGFAKNRKDEIFELYKQTKEKSSLLISLAESLKELNAMLIESATGYSLDSLYEEVPEPLKGYVEISYDINNRPLFRLREALLYKSDYYDESRQSLMLYEIAGDEREFILSTPVLKEKGRFHYKRAFSSKNIDALYSLKRKPQELGWIRESLDLTDEELDELRPLLTSSMQGFPTASKNDKLRWRFFGHACVLLEVGGFSVLVDPLIAYSEFGGVSRYTFDDLPENIDCVLITHSHQDHLALETLLQLRHRVKKIIVPQNNWGALQDPSLKLLLNETGFDNVVECQEFDVFEFGRFTVNCLPFLGEHADLDINSKMTYAIDTKNHKFLFASDTNAQDLNLYERIHEVIGDIDTIFVGMECDAAPLEWLYGPLLFFNRGPESWEMSKSRTLDGCNFERAKKIVTSLNCKEVYIHALGLEPWLDFLVAVKNEKESPRIVESDKLVTWCNDNSIRAERLFAQKEVHYE